MKKIVLSMAMLTLTVLCITTENSGIAAQPEEIDAQLVQTETQRAKQAIKTLATELQAELKKALNEGGPVNAITVCNTKAHQIAANISSDLDLTLKRVSLKNRNPDNVPNEWQKKVLADFEERKRNGEPVAELTYTEVLATGSGKEFRFMKAIPTGPICVKCHGTEISDEVKTRLDQLYPNDKARGFRPGDIRGAFVVISNITS